MENEDKKTDGAEQTETVAPEVETPKKEEIDWKAKYYYMAAEMDNLRKRMEREKEDQHKFGLQRVLTDLLHVVDNFERTIDMLKPDQDPKMQNIVVGLDMVRKQFIDAVVKHGLTPIESVGKQFDPHFHEAMAQEYAEGTKPNEVIKEFQKGYILNGRVVRPAKVVVSSDKQ